MSHCSSCGRHYAVYELIGHEENCSWYSETFVENRLIKMLREEFRDNKIEISILEGRKCIIFEGHNLNCSWKKSLGKELRVICGIDPVLDIFYILKNQIDLRFPKKMERHKQIRVFKRKVNNGKDYILENLREIYPFNKFEFKKELHMDCNLYFRLHIDEQSTDLFWMDHKGKGLFSLDNKKELDEIFETISEMMEKNV